MVSDSVVKSITNRLVESFDPEKIILFGSVARGTADEHSDMDILVICPISGSRRAMMVACLLYTSPSPRDRTRSRMPSSA